MTGKVGNACAMPDGPRFRRSGRAALRLAGFATSIAIAAKALAKWTGYVWRKSVPLLLCIAGGAIWKSQDDWHGGLALFLAVAMWGFALDLMSDRASGHAKVDMASRFFAMAADDHEITITTNHEYRADAATIAAIEAQGMSAGTAKTEGLGATPASPVAKPCAQGEWQ